MHVCSRRLPRSLARKVLILVSTNLLLQIIQKFYSQVCSQHYSLNLSCRWWVCSTDKFIITTKQVVINLSVEQNEMCVLHLKCNYNYCPVTNSTVFHNAIETIIPEKKYFSFSGYSWGTFQKHFTCHGCCFCRYLGDYCKSYDVGPCFPLCCFYCGRYILYITLFELIHYFIAQYEAGM